MFFGFACFVGFALLVAWQFAAAELADLQKERSSPLEENTTEVVSAKSEAPLFI